MSPKHKTSKTGVSELRIQPDGKILAHNITPVMARVLAVLNPRDRAMKQRASQSHSPR